MTKDLESGQATAWPDVSRNIITTFAKIRHLTSLPGSVCSKHFDEC
jgi:hypothetical protein